MHALKALDNLNMIQMMKLIFDSAENIVGKGENAGYQHFLLFPQCFHKFQKTPSTRSLKLETAL